MPQEGGGAKNDKWHNEAHKLINEAVELVHAERFMTIQHELAYSSGNILAHTESNKWYDTLLANAPRRPNKHWAAQLKSAKQCKDMTALLQKRTERGYRSS